MSKKKHIPKAVRMHVWLTHIGRKFESKCYICGGVIDVFNYHCGHITAEHYGGEATVENLRPTCMACNCSIGSQNMDEFREEWGLKSEIKKEQTPLKLQIQSIPIKGVKTKGALTVKGMPPVKGTPLVVPVKGAPPVITKNKVPIIKAPVKTPANKTISIPSHSYFGGKNNGAVTTGNSDNPVKASITTKVTFSNTNGNKTINDNSEDDVIFRHLNDIREEFLHKRYYE